MQEESQQNVQQFQECLERQKEEGRRQEMELALLCEKISQKRAEIAKKIGEDREPEQYFQMAQKRLLQMQENYKQKKQQKEQAERSLKEKEETWNSVNGEERGSRAALEQAQSRLLKEMEKQGFSAREEVEYALLTDAVCQVYTEQVETYERQLREAEVQAAETEKKLNGRKITRECYESCVRQCSELEEQIPSHRESVIAGKQELQRMYEGLERQRELMRQKELLAHNIAVLEDLQSVTRGKRFVEFMAMERLKYISKSASKRLYEITNGNYELEINGEGEFVIRDNKNGGVIRQTSTLSGGETFVTSLALALALSAEIQLKGTAPLELFFLDEGFGSLDETLLDIVMESLEKIHHEQLKVGIISHVESVKTRVPVRLLVSPAETGVSGSKVRMEYS